MKVLVACEESGVVREAFVKNGHDAWSCDLLPTRIPGNHIQDDILSHLNDDWDLVIAHPPCTFLTVAGNKWMKPEYSSRFPNRQRERELSIEFFMEFVNCSAPKFCIENPIGIISTVYRKPDQIIHPYHFGHNFSKATCYWLKGLPKLQPTNIVEPEWYTFKSGKRMSMEHFKLSSLSKEVRARERSKTPQGIADAMADQWGKE